MSRNLTPILQNILTRSQLTEYKNKYFIKRDTENSLYYFLIAAYEDRHSKELEELFFSDDKNDNYKKQDAFKKKEKESIFQDED